MGKKKKERKYLIAIIIALLLLLPIFFVWNAYYSPWSSENAGMTGDDETTGANDGAANGGTNDGNNDDGSEENDDDEKEAQRTFTGGGVIDPDAPCTTYTVTERYDDPYLLFSYRADWGFCDCEEQVIIWKIYSDNVLIKTITQDEPGSGQTIIRNYNGGDIKVCLQQRCMYCDVTVSWTITIMD